MALGPYCLNFLDLKPNNELISQLAEFTLALVLFTDASMLRLNFVKKYINIPRRLLAFGLPLTIVFGFLIALLLFDQFTWIEAMILSVILAPTDAAQGKTVVEDKRIPNKIRTGLDVESGLNDGICVPILLACFALASNMSGNDVLMHGYFIKTTGIGLISGLGLAFFANTLINKVIKLNIASETWNRVVAVTLAISIFALAQWLGGSGFIACFSGGLLFGYLARKNQQKFELAAEGIGEILSLATWVVFGATIVAKLFSESNLLVWLYAALSLTFVRMMPVSLALTGLNFNRPSRLFMGWFGPRGLASIVFVVMALDQNLPHFETISNAAIATILLSIFAHGLTANVLVTRYGKQLN